MKTSSEAATVAWMLSLLATIGAEGLGLATRLAMLVVGSSVPLQAFSGTLLLVAALTGVLLLILTPLVLKVRDTPPPKPLVVAAYVAGTVPILTLVLMATGGGTQ